jgi:hypothetical protein
MNDYILVLGRDTDAHVIWLRHSLADRPIMTAEKLEGIKNLLPIATHVFIRPITYPWVSRLDLPVHPSMFMVGTGEESVTAGNILRNFREANIQDTFVVDDPADTERLKARFAIQIIEEHHEPITQPPF